jgi:sugar phosphate isomerase/epimerase
MSITRRTFLTQTTAALAGTALLHRVEGADAPGAANVRIGACVVGLEQARQAGLEGVEVGVGDAAERLAIAEPGVQARYKEQMAKTGLPICSLMMGLFNSYPLASDPRAKAWMEQSIDAAHDLGARVILLAFFGDGDLLDANERVKEAAVDAAVERIRAAAPRAKDAGVILGIENYLNGEQNARILDRINHEAVQLYFDVYNTGTTKRHDVPGDIRRLQGRIAQFHFKNGDRYLDDERGKFEPIAAAIRETGYQGWIVLETSSPAGNAVADAKRNGDYVRSLFG